MCILHLPILGIHVSIAAGWLSCHAQYSEPFADESIEFPSILAPHVSNLANMAQSVRGIVNSISLENTALACKAAQKSLGLNLVDTVPLNQTEVEANW